MIVPASCGVRGCANWRRAAGTQVNSTQCLHSSPATPKCHEAQQDDRGTGQQLEPAVGGRGLLLNE